ncbi:CBS domain-containing protein [Roseomonas eburnea]|uniref:CBS domain-containing protein n=1 Tax=Neoroseomonas eburnea TaxID=1346889 RepID=A0A9X9XJH0_9PROT|nr:CBS domain-containing protein [Neoroseomonas eburnea]MBR0683856.1 CBS domain-containing protein [Neoroseomonas eburnea]
MTSDVLSIDPDDSVGIAARKLSERGVSAAPVIDAEGRLIGVISEGDLLQPFCREKQLQRAWWLRILAEGEAIPPALVDYIRLDKRRVRDLMTSPVVTVTEDTPLPVVADLLLRHRIKRVPVLRDSRVVGIVSRADLVRALARAPDAITEPI